MLWLVGILENRACGRGKQSKKAVLTEERYVLCKKNQRSKVGQNTNLGL